ncbi:signal peptide peptidase SppA [Bacillus sp. HMF5848]|uniref:signal peptide peptidase SppA n=1 Tax=Bacillus sp. HMF5848 TaxID=2495421 RepID=UPI000F78F643|nr:signal peptide peptidase SppA [Bacillus sp. HMF5848]RSK28177.1 signal peptide peptidase SppA [Bacillus sp. HMF5848]
MNGKRWAALGIAAVLFIFSIVINFATSALFGGLGEDLSGGFLSNLEDEYPEEILEDGDPFNKVLLLNVDGVIQDVGEIDSLWAAPGYNHRAMLKKIEKAEEDSSIKAIVLRVNSPGGGVAESAELYDKLLAFKENTDKPIYVSMGSMAASGGYYISMVGDKIFASKETITGSLGVIIQSYNYAELANKYGVEVVTVKSGPYKDIMNPGREMTAPEEEIIQSMVNNSYEGFVDVIAKGRNLSDDRVRQLADGRIYDGRQAKDLKLIDEFGYLDDTIAAIQKDYNLSGSQVVTYGNTLGISGIFGMTLGRITKPDSELSNLLTIISQTNSPRPMYLYAR